MIHATAIIHPDATVDPSAEIGPYAIIDQAVEIGPECVIGPHVYITGITQVGARNRFFAGAVIGEAPQDIKYRNEPTGVRIGADNVFRENVTVHRSSKPGEYTVLGSNNLLMAGAHVGHNSHIGNHVIMANGCMLGGYARLADRAFISGNCLVHQFTHVGTLAMMQGGSAVSKDLPPFTMARGENRICGLNIVGLRRAGISSSDRLQLKQLYREIFRSGGSIKAGAKQAVGRFTAPAAATLIDFILASTRGVCADFSRGGKRLDDLESA